MCAVSSRHGKGSLGSLSQTRAVVETPIMKVWSGLDFTIPPCLWCPGDQHAADGPKY